MVTILVLLAFAVPMPLASQLLVDDFDYTVGSNLTDNGWVQVRSGNSIAVEDEELDELGYPGAGIGGAITLELGDQSVKRVFTEQDTGAVYVSFLIRVIDASTTTDTGLFFWLGVMDSTIFNRTLSILANKNDSDELRFGLSGGGGFSATDYVFELDKTYLMVVRYQFNAGEDDDQISLWVDPEIEPAEPPADLTRTVSSDASEIAEIILTGEDSSNVPPTAQIDSLRVETGWLPAVLFSDDLDSGDTTAWSSTVP